MDIKHPHDSFFKQLMSDTKNLADFIRNTLPDEVARNIDYDSLRLVDNEVIKKNYKRYNLDIIAEVNIGNKPCEVMILFEHKSYYDKFTIIQILSYMLATWENNIKNNEPLKPIIPIVFYHGKQKYDLPVDFEGYFEVPEYLKDYIVKFRYELFDTAIYDKGTLEEKYHNNLFLLASLMAFKNIFSDIDDLIEVKRYILNLENDLRFFVVEYIYNARDEEETEVLKNELEVDAMATVAMRLIEKGKYEGLQEGIFKGKLEGEKDALAFVFDLKYGKNGLDFYNEIRDKLTSLEDIENIKVLIKKYDGLEELKKDLKA